MTSISVSELPPPSGRTGWPWTGEGVRLPDTMPGGRPWPRLCVVTPSFNQGAYLEATIRSVLLQGYPNFEYIVMDGGSTDGSVEIIRKYEPWLSHWESNPDGGQYKAIQQGFASSHAEVMAWLNSDDLYFPWALRAVGEIMGQFRRIEWLSSENIASTSGDGSMFNFTHVNSFSRFWFLNYRQHRLTKRFIQQESTFWRRGLWERAGGRFDADLDFAGDFELWARFFQHANLVSTNAPLGIFRYHPGQKTNDFERYLTEVQSVLARYPRPINLPYTLLRILVHSLTRIRPEENWLGRRAERVWYDAQYGQWRLQTLWDI